MRFSKDKTKRPANKSDRKKIFITNFGPVPSLDQRSYVNGHPAELEQIFSHSELFNISELLSVQSIKSAQITIDGRQKFRINISYKTSTQITPRTIAVAEAFGLGIDETREFTVYRDLELVIGPTDVVYVMGDSGSGKSVLLRTLENQLQPKMNIKDVEVDETKPLIDTVGKDVKEGLRLLCRVGLNDAFLFVRRYPELSDGQKYRYRLAKLVESGAQFWIADEFCSTLDRDTAKVVAFNMQKVARKEGKGLIVATCNRDLLEDLGPNVYVEKRFGEEVKVRYFSDLAPTQCSLVREMKIVKGAMEDWKKLARFHYRSHSLPPVRKIFALKRHGTTVGVIVYSHPPMICFGRSRYFKNCCLTGLRKGVEKTHLVKGRDINDKLSSISRVVVHPKFRTIGLGVKLVRETLAKAGTPFVEAVAVMARYNPFFERAGLTKIAEKKPNKDLVKLQDYLEQTYSFSRVLLNSVSYNLGILRSLTPEQVNDVKAHLINCRHFFLRKCVFSEKQYRAKYPEKKKQEIYARNIKKMNVEGLARLLSIVARLTQVKVYLVWSRRRKPRVK